MVVAQRQLAFLLAAAAFAVEQPLLLCSPGGRDGFGSQYFHHMAVFGACAAHGDCCYVHSSFQTLAHGADPLAMDAKGRSPLSVAAADAPLEAAKGLSGRARSYKSENAKT